MRLWYSSHLPIAATFSKDPRFWGNPFTPNILYYGNGAYLTGLGSPGRWLDWVSGLGAIILGNGYPTFCERVEAQLHQGVGFSLPHYLEAQVASKLCQILGHRVPGWTPDGLGVRFGLSGTDACSMAVRLARAATGRVNVGAIGYHGWHDMFVETTPPAWGVRVGGWGTLGIDAWDFGNTSGLPWAFIENYAAIIIEQPLQEPPAGYYTDLRRLCDRYRILLIVDEVVTWPRYSLGGACELYGIEPDICCYGKALGNGVPISAIVGRREYFDWFARNDPVFVSSTGFGNALSLAAADAVLDIWTDDCVKHLWDIGKALMTGLREAGYSLIGNAPRSLLQFPTPAERAYFIRGMADRGILINRPNLPNMAHTMGDVALTVTAASEVRAEMAQIDVEAEMADKLPAVLFEGR